MTLLFFRFPEATFEELEEADQCIICRDILYEGARKLPCGHVFHIDCLKAWFVQQQTCPTCRSDVLIAARTLPPPAMEHTEELVEEISPATVRATSTGASSAARRESSAEVQLGLLKRMFNYVAPGILAKDSEVEDMRWQGNRRNKQQQQSSSSGFFSFMSMRFLKGKKNKESRSSLRIRSGYRVDRREVYRCLSSRRRHVTSDRRELRNMMKISRNLAREIELAKEMVS